MNSYCNQFYFLRRNPVVKVSEEQSEKSGTETEESEAENCNKTEIPDYRNFEQIFRPRHHDLDRTTEITNQEFQAPPEISEPESLPTLPYQGLTLKSKHY